MVERRLDDSSPFSKPLDSRRQTHHMVLVLTER